MRNVLSVFSFYTEENWGSERLRALPRLTQLYQSEPGLNWEGLSGLENQPALPLQRFFCIVIPPEDTGRVVSLKTVPFLVCSGNWRSQESEPQRKKTKETHKAVRSAPKDRPGKQRAQEQHPLPGPWPWLTMCFELYESMGCCAYVLCTHKGEKAPPGIGTTSPLRRWKSWYETGYFQGPVCE